MIPAARGRPRARGSGPGLALIATLILARAGLAAPVSPAPVVFQSAPGRFEVAAADPDAARAVVAPAGEGWTLLAPVLGLPAAFESPIFVRVIPTAAWTDSAEFRLWVEPGGVVSLRLQAGRAAPVIRRALTEALLAKLAVWRHGAGPARPWPRWLVAGALAWWSAQRHPAELDRLQQESATLAPPPLDAVLRWHQDDPPTPRLVAGSAWLLRFLMDEGGAGEWARLLDRLLAGDAAARALRSSYPGRFADEAERELWWQVGWQALRRVPALPTLDAAESRALVSDASRIVMGRNGRDVLVGPADWPELARSRAGRAGLAERARALAPHLAMLHPFYRNAGLSLMRLLDAAQAGDAGAASAALVAFDADWRAGSELEAASTRALDAFAAQREAGR